MALAALAGMLCSPKLWISSDRLFPATPLFGWIPQLPFPVDYILFGLLLAALAGIAVWPRPAPFLKAFLTLAALLVVFDQSRLQPWLLEYSVILGALLLAPWERWAAWTPEARDRVLHPCRLFLVCMYFYAGLQKLNYGFVFVLALLVKPLFEQLGLNTAWLAPRTLVPVAIVLALVECLSGLLLAFPRTRTPAVACLVLMHITLLLWLGPLGLKSNPSVWPWNLAMIVLLVALFLGGDRWGWKAMWRSHPYARAVGVAFGVLPLLTMLGVADSYLGFSLYSGNIKEAMLYIDPKQLPQLPAPVRAYAKADGLLDIDRWSNEELGVPVYPETRIYTSVGRQVALWLPAGVPVRVLQFEKPHPITGQRKATAYDPLTY